MDPDQRRALIREAAAEAFAAEPYDRVSLATIATQSGASEALIHKYFDTKAGLYAEVIRDGVAVLVARQRAAAAALPSGASARDQVRSSLIVYLDYIAAHPSGWSATFLYAGNDPQPALDARREIRSAYVEALRELLGLPGAGTAASRDEFALWGYFGFLDGACLRWVHDGCREDQRWPLIEAALGCLEGALGDWRR